VGIWAFETQQIFEGLINQLRKKISWTGDAILQIEQMRSQRVSGNRSLDPVHYAITGSLHRRPVLNELNSMANFPQNLLGNITVNY
jgi:hypothetical protein